MKKLKIKRSARNNSPSHSPSRRSHKKDRKKKYSRSRSHHRHSHSRSHSKRDRKGSIKKSESNYSLRALLTKKEKKSESRDRERRSSKIMSEEMHNSELIEEGKSPVQQKPVEKIQNSNSVFYKKHNT